MYSSPPNVRLAEWYNASFVIQRSRDQLPANAEISFRRFATTLQKIFALRAIFFAASRRLFKLCDDYDHILRDLPRFAHPLGPSIPVGLWAESGGPGVLRS